MASSEGQIRWWPGFLIVALQWLVTFGGGLVAPATPLHFFSMMGGPPVGLLLLLLWWTLASGASGRDRWLVLVWFLVLPAAVLVLLHPSVPMAMMIYGIPILSTVFVGVGTLSRRWPVASRRRLVAVAMVVAVLVWPLVRVDGVDGDMATEFAWRWQTTPEERLVAAGTEFSRDVSNASASQTAPSAAWWPEFRGDRTGVVPGVRLATDWQTSPPEALWRRSVGPGWSSLTVVEGRLYTQEQRGEEEWVTAYDAATGEPIWGHSDTARFWEALAGAGPRATPTYDEGRLFTFGATGLLNALDAETGAVLWRRDSAADTGAETPMWGFASSPLVTEGLVVVHTGAGDGKAVVAYAADSGEPRWFAPAGPLSYSSLQRVRLHDVDQLLIATGDGVSSFVPQDGTVLWSHAWQVPGGARIVQPVVTPDQGVLLGTGFGMGVRRLAVDRRAEGVPGWQARELWTSRGMKPYYNDFVLHGEHLYGFDGRILACLDLETGERRWKGGRYGNGQLILLADQDLLLVLSDRGEVALVDAQPEGFNERAKVTAISGKTWNHPVLTDGVLYVRNGEEMAALRLAME